MSAMLLTIQALLADNTLSTAVSNRVSPVIARQNEKMPRIVVYSISDGDQGHMNGPSSEMFEGRVTVEVHGETAIAVTSIGDMARTVLNRTINTEFLNCKIGHFRKAETDFADYDDDTKVFRRMTDYRVFWKPL